jgi:hypothetical protein
MERNTSSHNFIYVKAHALIPAMVGITYRKIIVETSPGIKLTQDLISKITRTKGDGGVAQAIECLLSKHEALSLNPSISKKF